MEILFSSNEIDVKSIYIALWRSLKKNRNKNRMKAKIHDQTEQ